jgi:DNA polymerase elongation subunit (family B)
MIYSNVRELVEHQQYVFDTLWNKSIPSQEKIKEIEDGIQPSYIETIRDPVQILTRALKLVTSARDEILLLFSTANALYRQGNTRLSREILMRTKDVVQELGYTLLYADTDSVFLQKSGATLEDFISIKDILARETGLPISLESYYKFLVLLPLEADERIEALKHHYGISHNNELIVRGIEIRRHDAPNFIKDFQSELLYTLFDCKDSTEVLLKGYENALLVVTKTIDKVMTGELELKDLVVSKILRQDLYKYRSLFPHVSAALQLTQAGVPLVRGDTIQYIYTDATHSNPLRRVTPLDLVSGEEDYDREKYRDMLLEAAETVLLGLTGRYLEILAATIESGGIISENSAKKT